MTPKSEAFNPSEEETAEWDVGLEGIDHRQKIRSSQHPSIPIEREDRSPLEIWVNPHLEDFEGTANLDNQQPATLYYLGRVQDIPEVCEIYVEELENHRRKHWTVIRERNYDAMDSIYDIEQETMDKFPLAEISFRVTVKTDRGPSVAPKATKIYDVE